MTNWSQEQVEALLKEHDLKYRQRAIEHGIQFTLQDGTPIDWYNSGKVVVRGKQTSLKSQALQLFSENPSTMAAEPGIHLAGQSVQTRVFIVYGHDVNAREQLELILRRLKLEPIVLQNLPGAGDTIIEKLEVLTSADFACVLLTPDDEGHPYGQPDKKRPRARQNVTLELGMVLAKLGRKRVAILNKGDEIEAPSDIQGLLWIPFKNHVDEAKNLLAANLQEAGFVINLKDLLG